MAAWLAIWARRRTKARHAAMVVLVVGLASLAAAAVETAGFPKPLRWAWELSGEARVLGVKLVQDVGIYLYVDIGTGAPRSYSLPWSNEAASRIQGLMDGNENGEFMMKFEWSWDMNEPQFYELPQPIIPLPKQQLAPTPRLHGA
jgi:hypothetical protein